MFCRICKNSGPIEVALRDGSVIHEQCLKLDLSEQKNKVRYRRQLLYQEIKALRPNYSFLDFFFGNKVEDARIAEERSRINAAIESSEDELMRLVDREEKHSQMFAFEIERAINLWPGYPPDEFWQRLRNEVKKRANFKCQDCSRYLKYNGDVHHKVPISLGGLNNISNLQLLCRSCHEIRHGGRIGYPIRPINGIPDYISLNIRQRIDLAMSTKRKVNIIYTNDKNETTKRWVNINRIYWVGNSNRIEMIDCYCNLRKEERTFRVDRISKADVFGMK